MSQQSLESYDVSVLLPFYKKMSEFKFVLPYNYKYFSQKGVEVVIIADEPLCLTDFSFLNQYPSLDYKIIVNEKEHKWRNPSKVINVGIRNASRKFILILSPESIMKNNIIKTFFEQYKDNSFVTGYVGFIDRNTFRKNFDETKITFLNYGSIFIKKDDLINVGGYDESFEVWGGDDDEVRLRLKKNGFEQIVCSKAKVLHIDLLNRKTELDKKKNENPKKYELQKRKLVNVSQRLDFTHHGLDFDCVLIDKTDSIEKKTKCQQINLNKMFNLSIPAELNKTLNELLNAIHNTNIYDDIEGLINTKINHIIDISHDRKTMTTSENLHKEMNNLSKLPDGYFKTAYLEKHPLIVGYKFGSRLKQHYEIFNLTPIFNEAENIQDFIKSTRRFADGILILDDGSDDNCCRLLAPEDYTLIVRIKRGKQFEDLRNRNLLLDVLQKMFLDQKIKVDWIVWLDCDERIASSDKELMMIKQKLRKEQGQIFKINMYHMWDEDHYNADYPSGKDGLRKYVRIFKNVPSKRPYIIKSKDRLHFKLIPYLSTVPIKDLPLRIKHYGMSTKEKRRKKYENYIKLYDKQKIQNSYEHIIKDNPKLIMIK